MSAGRQLAEAGRYLSFRLGTEVYGLPILTVRELIGVMDITRVPGSHTAFRGVINLRGKVISILDLRRQFQLGATPLEPHTVVVVIERQNAATEGAFRILGILADEVLEVITLAESQLAPLPPMAGGAGLSPDFFLGVGKAGEQLVLLLNIDEVLAAAEHPIPPQHASTPAESP